jgi:hypothetical protein
MRVFLAILSLTIINLTAFSQFRQSIYNLPVEHNKADVAENVSTTKAVAYRLFPTQNMWTFIKLDTRSGQMWQVQFDVNGNSRGVTFLNLLSLVSLEEEVNDRFTLYPTQNMYNFILLDQLSGKTWQVQWSQKAENRGVIPIE